MDDKEWQKRLTDNFEVNDRGALFQLYGVEDNCGRYITEKFHGYIALIDSFQSFYIETIQSAYSWVSKNSWPENCENYAPIVAYFVNLFKSFRACENLLMKGYPLDGYALHRDLKDRAIFMAAIALNITTLNAIFGISGLKNITNEEDVKIKVRSDRIKEEHIVLNKMIRKDSGLPSEIITELEKWESLFHEEVHGSKLSYFTELRDWTKKGVSTKIGPSPNETAMAMYMNRSCEIGWLITRLFPYLQVVENAFDDKWHDKYIIFMLTECNRPGIYCLDFILLHGLTFYRVTGEKEINFKGGDN